MSSLSSVTLAGTMKLIDSVLRANQTGAAMDVKLLEAALEIQRQMAAEMIKMLEGLGRIVDVQA